MEKHCVGIDVSKDYLDCCLGSTDSEQNHIIGKNKRFTNNESGFAELLKWVGSLNITNEIFFVMEATGVYYENLIYFLNDNDCKACVLLPNMVKYYAKSINVKTKTDGKDSEVLCRLGLERKLRLWHVPSSIIRDLKFLCREYREIKYKLTQAKNQLHARSHSYRCPENIEKRLKIQIELLNEQSLEIESEIRLLVQTDSMFNERIKKIITIPGVSFMTVVCIVAETNAFSLITNSKQLVSYTGLDIQQNQSGQKQGKSKISKKGNSFIRQSLYMPALCASRYNPPMKEFYDKLKDRKPAKKIAVTAVARKLLILIYQLWKNNEEFDSNYEQNKKQTGLRLSEQDEHIILLK